MPNNRYFFVWKKFQRRAESIGQHLNCTVRYYHFSWEEKGKVFKLLSYVPKSIAMLRDLVTIKPSELVIQLPPVPALYLVALYGKLTGARFIADCHNAMIDGPWIKAPFAVKGLQAASAVVVHNEDIRDKALALGLSKTVVALDPLPQVSNVPPTELLDRLGLAPGGYVIVPWNFAFDEPIAELAAAANRMSGTTFVATWFKERLSSELLNAMPANVIFSGYLDVPDFNALFANAGVAISLTVREGTQPSAASEAIAFGIPLVLSNLQTAKRLYGDHVIRVENEPEAIAAGIQEALTRREFWRQRIVDLRTQLSRRTEQDMEVLKGAFAAASSSRR